MTRRLEEVTILGVGIQSWKVSALHSAIQNIIETHTKALVLNVNAYCLNLAYQYPWLRKFLNSAKIIFSDGVGVVVGAKILGYKISNRITYADWAWQLAEYAEPRKFTFFFLGARPGIADKAADKLKTRYPNLRIIGTHHGYFDKKSGSLENEIMIEKINTAKPNILIVGFGMPLQERWLMENWDGINANIALTGGAVFDYISGELQRAPKWMTNNNLEWLGRLLIEPRRLWKRYIIGNPLFLWRVIKQKFKLTGKKHTEDF